MMLSVETKRICLIGSSLLGAVLKAYQSAEPSAGLDLSFLASVESEMNSIEIDGGIICNIMAASAEASLTVADYDGFVIYCDMRTPHEMVRAEQYMRQNRYSQQVGEAALFDMVSSTATWRLRNLLKAITDAPVYFLSCNVARPTLPLRLEAQYLRGTELLRMLVDDERYIEFPRALFGETYAPNPDYYRGSIDISRNTVASARDPYHDDTHLNEAGGKLVLDQILQRLEADLFPA